MKFKILFILALSITGCQDKFPVSDLYRVNHIDKICEVYKINPDKVSFKFDHDLPFDNCPTNIFGFNEEDSGKVTAWVRRQKKKYDK